jgi:hypothetical protein
MRFLEKLFSIVDTFHKDLKTLAERIHDNTEAAKDRNTADKTQNIPQPFAVSIPEGIENRKSAADKKDEATYQDKTLFWQRWTFVALVVYALFTLFIYCANKRVADIASRQLEMSERPWVSSETNIAGPVIFDSEGIHGRFDVHLSATGHSPAVGVRVNAKIAIAEFGQAKRTLDARVRLCEETAKETFMRDYEDTMFPSDQWVKNVDAIVMDEDQEPLRKEHVLSGFRLIVCVAYRPSFRDDIAYYTGNIYRINRNDIPPIGLQRGTTIPIEKLRIERWADVATIVGQAKRPTQTH